jgi:hypothetical protein
MKLILKEAFRVLYFFSPIILFFVLSTMTLARDDMKAHRKMKKQETGIQTEKNRSGGSVELP